MLYNLKPHPDLVRPLRLGQRRAPNTIRSLKPNAFCRNQNSIFANSITTVIQKEEISFEERTITWQRTTRTEMKLVLQSQPQRLPQPFIWCCKAKAASARAS